MSTKKGRTRKRPVPATDELAEAARKARTRAYAPYSRYRVGAAVRGDNGKIYRGANLENASYGLSVCAERNAVAAAVSDGVRHIVACAVLTASSPPAAPCGMCRQTLMEFAPKDPARVQITMLNEGGERRETTLDALLPLAFRPRDLG
jgi:cytidine deaminase